MQQEEKPFIVYSVLDPAIDTEQMPVGDMAKYADTRDASLLKWKAGVPKTAYHLREIRHSVWESFVMAAESASERYRNAFLCAVLKVEHMLQRDGSVLSVYQHANVPRDAAMPSDEAERFPPYVRAEIGMVAFTRSFLGWGIAPAFPLPHLLVPYLEARTFLRADATPASPAPSSSPASSDQAPTPATPDATTPAPSKSEGSSASPTPATATGQQPEAA